MSSRISDFFWGDNGYSVIESRMEQVKDCNSTWATFMKERAAIEENYAKQLSNLLKGTASLVEFGSTRDAWLCVRAETEGAIAAARSCAQSLQNECYSPLSKFKDTQSKARKQALSDAYKVIKENEKQKQALQKSREKYEKLTLETDKAQRVCEQGKGNKNPNELLKLTSKVQKLAKETLQAERDAEDMANRLSSYQNVVADTTIKSYDVLQRLEEERIDFLKILLNKFSEILTRYSEFSPKACQRIAQKVSAIDPEEDVASFILEKQTGGEKPKPTDITFTPIRSSIDYANYAAGHSALRGELTDSAELHSSHSSSHSSLSLSYSYNSFNSNTYQEQEQSYDDSQQVNDGTQYPVQVLGECKALWDYVGADQHELDLQAGDVIRILERDQETGWWTGELNGRTGLFPSNYVEEL